MMSLVSFRRGLITALVAALFSTSLMAGDEVEPTWVKEGVNWAKYTKFLVQPLDVQNVQVIRPPWAEDDPEEWTLNIDDLQGIQSIFRDSMKDVLTANGGYPVVYTEGDDVLEVEVEILSITPWLRPGSASEVEGMQVKTLGSGELTASVELRDSTTRELLLLIEGDTAVGEKYKEFTLQNNVDNITAMFSAFAQRLRNSLDAVHGK